MEKKVWYVTGASKGMGRALVKRLLREGHQVAATSRTLQPLVDSVNNETTDFLPLEVDLSDETSVAASVKDTISGFGRIDVVVNNAGYGIGGTLEELSLEETRANFEVTLFAPIIVIQQVMPYLRAQRKGHIINIASIAGFAGA